MTRRIARLLSISLVVVLTGCPSKQQDQQAQTQPASAPAAAPASAPVAASVAAAASVPLPASAPEPQAQQFPPEEIEALVAPIALYPDSLLSQILMASTYPLEIVHAARWVKTHKELKGEAAVKAVQDQPWDVSVKSLVAFPQVLEPMNDKLDWTQRLGDAFLANEKDVLDAVQRLRVRAQKAGHLTSNAQQKVVVEAPAPSGGGQRPQGGQTPQTIVRIEPSNPQAVYVPSYNPTVVYGGWSAPAYPPTYWPPYPAYYPGAALATGFAWGVGIAAAGALFGNCNWNNNDVNINVNKAANIDRNFDRTKVEGGKWKHDAGHRQGVAYRDNATRDRYSKGTQGADARRDYRGRTGGATERASVANRAEAGNRTGRQNNATAADRTGRTNTAGAGDRPNKSDRGATASNRAQTSNRNAAAGNRAQTSDRSTAASNRAQASDRGAAASNRAQTSARAAPSNAQTFDRSGGGYSGGGRDSAFQGVGGGTATQRDYNRGQASAQSSNYNRGGGAARGGGGGGGGARGGGGGRR
ncbi:DUF3300 domain-containing protein [Paraburkholderia phytofirmans]|jgi:hypothetical protein|uniref:DUF3300 domain-containing protein n=1 Tax=Paraburkholderia sp. BL9I2N2 TaxID=1938809 RepID=UPI0010DDEFE6|nr:DUF3300 domain-containing protein [Paraburkholderia sp. BL9I2N2]TCK87803.1 uncharacterized protein DUF3300 [Paraburkholderia sp. BL9I2N2]